MSNERVSDERLAEMLRIDQRERARFAAGTFSFDRYSERISILTELQQRRASVVTPEMVERGLEARAIVMTVREALRYGGGAEDAGVNVRAALTAALSVSHETGDGETEVGLRREFARFDAAMEEFRAPTDETQGVERHMPTRERMRELVKSGPDLEVEAGTLHPEAQGVKREDNWESLRVMVAKAIHAADYGPHVDLELEWDANEDGRMKQADAALMVAGIRSLISDVADMESYIRQRDDAISDLETAEASLAAISARSLAAEENGR